MKTYAHRKRTKRGAVLAEFAGALVVFLPICIMLLFVVVEVSHCYMIKACLAEGARRAARGLAIDYGLDPSIAPANTVSSGDRAMEEADVLDAIRIPAVIVSSDQFTGITFDTRATGRSVKVVVEFQGGHYGLSPFPFPDPLNLGANFRITADSTYRLE